MNKEEPGLDVIFKLAIYIYHTVMVSVLWFVCCLPVITIPAASAAVYTLAPLIYTDCDLPLIPTFGKLFWQRIRIGIPAALMLILSFILVGLSIYTSLSLLPFGFLSSACTTTGVLFFMLGCMLMIAIPTCLNENITFRNLLAASCTLLAVKYVRLLLLVFLLFFCVFLSLECFIVLLILPALYAYLSYRLLERKQ